MTQHHITLSKSKQGRENSVLISTMPKSGTWYTAYFLYFLHHLLLKSKDIHLPLSSAFLKESHIQLNRSFNFDRFFLCHTTCPGFQQYLGKHKAAWDKIEFRGTRINYGSKQVEQAPDIFNPELNDNSRIVYIYRNPLDQCLSAFRQRMHSINQQNLVLADGRNIQITNPSECLRHESLDNYIKQFITFKVTAPYFPKQILMISYEELITYPFQSFNKILSHIITQWPKDLSPLLIKEALRLASKDSLRLIEIKYGRSLADDQPTVDESHIRDGGIGSWRGYFSNVDIEYLKQRLAEFDLSVMDFKMLPLREDRVALNKHITIERSSNAQSPATRNEQINPQNLMELLNHQMTNNPLTKF